MGSTLQNSNCRPDGRVLLHQLMCQVDEDKWAAILDLALEGARLEATQNTADACACICAETAGFYDAKPDMGAARGAFHCAQTIRATFLKDAVHAERNKEGSTDDGKA